MIEAFDGEFTFLKFLSILAFLTTVGLFFCGMYVWEGMAFWGHI
jgi:hypothetical protein